MQLQLLKSPLSKGEKWEKNDRRTVEICQTTDNRGTMPNVYFGIMKKSSKNTVIIEDLFLTVDDATTIAKEILKTVKQIKSKKSK